MQHEVVRVGKFNIGDIITTNKIIGIDEEKSNNKHKYYIVECLICHNIRSIRSDSLKCKCRKCADKNRKQYPLPKDITGQYFGNWLVLEKTPKKHNYYNCLCTKCGTIRDVFRGSLTSGTSKGCGCTKSWGEEQIKYFLEQNNFQFKREISFDDLISDKNRKLHFDFGVYIDNKLFCLIEFDGRQHYAYDENWNCSYEDFQRLQYIDRIKNEYVQQKNIKLLRIKENECVEEILIDFFEGARSGT